MESTETSSPLNKNKVVTALTSSVNELELPMRPFRRICNTQLELKHVWQVCVLSPKALRTIDGMGPKSIADIRSSCCWLLGCDESFLRFLQESFWEWAKSIGWKADASPEQQIQIVQYLKEWPTCEQSVMSYEP